jgi:predicted transglutaminase-like cysteine proteinase
MGVCRDCALSCRQIADKFDMHPMVALKLWTTPRENMGDANELSALERALQESGRPRRHIHIALADEARPQYAVQRRGLP